jgi:hypothetical protein
LNVKYEKEVRLCLGCALVSDTQRGEEGRRAVPFDYSGKVILSLKDWNARVATEIARINRCHKEAQTGSWRVVWQEHCTKARLCKSLCMRRSFNLGYEKANCRRSQGSFYTG